MSETQGNPKRLQAANAANGDPFQADREALVRLCDNPKARLVPKSESRPCRWHPYTVDRPRYEDFNIKFEDVTAFEFCAEQLRAGYPMERIALDKPLGCFGYVLRFPHSGGRELYVKLEISPNRDFVFGRSFHYSDKTPGEP